ncbi:hypothetical protein MTO96_034297 [Rhipicephalus appendiculatus]
MRNLHFPPAFVRLVDLLYSSLTCNVVVNGTVTPVFRYERGIRQGCPLGADLFHHVYRALLTRLAEDANIRGFPLHDLTLRKKALVTRTTVYAYANYVGRVAAIPNRTAAKLSSIANTFLWNGKPAPVRRTLLQLPVTSGGLGLPHAATTCKILALKTARYLNQATEYVGRSILRYWCSTNTHILETGRLSGPVAETPSVFYKAVSNVMKMVAKEAPLLRRRQGRTSTHRRGNRNQPIVRRGKTKAATAKKTRKKQARNLPKELHDFEWKRMWSVLPTRQRLHQLSIVPSARRP